MSNGADLTPFEGVVPFLGEQKLEEGQERERHVPKAPKGRTPFPTRPAETARAETPPAPSGGAGDPHQGGTEAAHGSGRANEGARQGTETPHGGGSAFALTDLFAEVPAPEEPVTSASNAPQPVAPQPVAPAAPETVHGTPGSFSLADRRARAEAAADNNIDLEARAGSELVASKQHHLDRLFNYVDRIAAFSGGDTLIQAELRNFRLTRDKDLDAQQRARYQEMVAPRLHEARIVIENPRDVQAIFDLAYDEYLGISILGDLWRDDTITEICVDAWDSISAERGGKLERTGYRFRSAEHAEAVARHLSEKISGRPVSPSNPLVTAQLPQARVQFMWGNVVASGIAMSMRKFTPLMGSAQLLQLGAMDTEMASFLQECVKARATILVAGGTGTGKTTAINALSEWIPDDERVITIEDAFELQLSNRHVVNTQAKPRTSGDDQVEVSQEDLLVASLRMRPDRIIVGEIREPDAAATMLTAAITGHDGTMTTIHAESPYSALNSRLVSLLMRSNAGYSEPVARLEVAQAVNLVVQIERSKGGRRYISQIAVVDPLYITETGIAPVAVFRGEVDHATGTISFLRAGDVDPRTELAARLLESAAEPGRWIGREGS